MMKKIALLLCLAGTALAQKHELGFTLGRFLETDRGTSTLESGNALQFNYGYRFWGNSAVAISGEFHLLASPLREARGPSTATRDYATLFLVPGVRVKFNPGGRVQPYGAVGVGYALYEQSMQTIGGQPNPAPRHVHEAALGYGGGLDVPVNRWLAIRGEVRDFYSGGSLTSGIRQHNVVAGGGFVLRFGQ